MMKVELVWWSMARWSLSGDSTMGVHNGDGVSNERRIYGVGG